MNLFKVLSCHSGSWLPPSNVLRCLCDKLQTLRILTPQKCLFWGPGPLLYRFNPFHWRVQGFLGKVDFRGSCLNCLTSFREIVQWRLWGNYTPKIKVCHLKRDHFKKIFRAYVFFSLGGYFLRDFTWEKKSMDFFFWFGFSSTNGKLVVWGPVVWDSNQDTPN